MFQDAVTAARCSCSRSLELRSWDVALRVVHVLLHSVRGAEAHVLLHGKRQALIKPLKRNFLALFPLLQRRSLTFDLLLHVLKECLCAVDIQLTLCNTFLQFTLLLREVEDACLHT